MTITLDHTIVPSNDKDEAARFFAEIFDLPYAGAGHFAPVQVNQDLTLDFSNSDSFEQHHYAFVVPEAEFDAIFSRIKAKASSYGSGPRTASDGELNNRRGGRGVYFRGGPDPHLWEIMTTPETGA